MMRPMRSTGTLTMALLILGLTASCGGDTTTTPQDMAGGGGGTTLTNLPTGCAPGVTADKLFTDTYMGNCAFGGCHSSATRQAGLDLTPAASYDALVGRRARLNPVDTLVIPGASNRSWLMVRSTHVT